MVSAVASMEMVKKSPTDAVPLYERTALCGTVNFEVELQPTNKQIATSSASFALFIREIPPPRKSDRQSDLRLEAGRAYRGNEASHVLLRLRRNWPRSEVKGPRSEVRS